MRTTQLLEVTLFTVLSALFVACGGEEEPTTVSPQSSARSGAAPGASSAPSKRQPTADDLGKYCDPWTECADGTTCTTLADGLDSGFCATDCKSDDQCPDGSACIWDVCVVGPRIDWSSHWTGDLSFEIAPGDERYLYFSFGIEQEGATSSTHGLAMVGTFYYSSLDVSAIALGDVLFLELTASNGSRLGGTTGPLVYSFLGRLVRNDTGTYVRGRALGPLAKAQTMSFEAD